MGRGLLSAAYVTSVFDHAKAPSDRRPTVAFAGRSNVGKSTLINGITEGKSIARVSSTPGKTQSLNFYIVEDRFYLVDLPGYGYAKVPVEIKKSWGKLVEGYLTASPSLRGMVFLIDCRREVQPDDKMLLNWVTSRRLPFLIVVTKADKLTRNQLEQALRSIRETVLRDDDNGELTAFSSRTKLGHEEVVRWVRQVVA